MWNHGEIELRRQIRQKIFGQYEQDDQKQQKQVTVPLKGSCESVHLKEQLALK